MVQVRAKEADGGGGGGVLEGARVALGNFASFVRANNAPTVYLRLPATPSSSWEV